LRNQIPGSLQVYTLKQTKRCVHKQNIKSLQCQEVTTIDHG